MASNEDWFTDEETNFFRLSALLVNEGTVIVRKKFDDKVKDTGKELAFLLKERQDGLKDYRNRSSSSETANSKPGIFTDVMWSQLYNTQSAFHHKSKPQCAQTSKGFDLTLLISLFKPLLKVEGPPSTGGNWSRKPSKEDISMQADILRLREMRNTLYAHAIHTSISLSDYEIQFPQLRLILNRLGVNSSVIMGYETRQCLNRPALEDMGRKLTELFENDLVCWHAYCEKMVATVQTSIKNIGLSNDTKLEKLTSKLDELLKKEDRTLVGHEQMSRCIQGMHKELVDEVRVSNKLIEDILRHLHDTHSNTESTRESGIQQWDKALISYQKQLLQEFSEKVQNITKSATVCPSNVKLDAFKPLLRNTDNTSFRLLMLTPPKPNGDPNDWIELGISLGQCPWDVIVDFDSETQEVGHIFDALSQALSQHKNFTVTDYKQLADKKSVSNDCKDQIASGQRTLYVKALGSSGRNAFDNKDGQFREPVVNTVKVLEKILKKNDRNKKLIVFVVVSSMQTNVCIQTMVERFEYDCEPVRKKSSYVICNVSNVDNVPDLTKYDGVHNCKTHLLQVTNKQVSSFFDSAFSSNTDGALKVAGNCTFTKRELTVFSSDLELYYADIGAASFTALTGKEVDDKEKQIRLEYLRGAPLSHEAMHMQYCNNHSVFVLRKEMVDILNEVKIELEHIGARFKKSRVLEILHDPSGGGTTCGRYILYELRNDYPCMEIKLLSETLYTSVSKIYTSCNKPCVMLIDMTDISKCHLVELKNRLIHSGIHFLILRVKLSNKSMDSVEESNENEEPNENQETKKKSQNLYLKSSVNEKDKAAFKRLFDESMELLHPTVFLFGLLAFCGNAEYVQKIERQIVRFTENASDQHKRILRLCCLVARFSTADNSIPFDLIHRLLDIEDDNLDEIGEKLDTTRDFLLITQSDVRMAVSKPEIVEMFRQKLFTQCNTSQFPVVLDDINVLVQADREDKASSYDVISRLLKGRTIDKYWSPFICYLESYSKYEVESLLKNLWQQFPDPKHSQYLRATYAKYLMHKLAKPEISLSEMRSTLDLKDQDVFHVETEDSELLSAYGHLCREYLAKHIPNIYANDTKQLLEKAASITREAVFVYKRAQQKGLFHDELVQYRHPAPFWGEAFARCSYAELVLKHRFKGDLSAFQKYVDSPCDDDLVKNFEKECTSALDKFEYFKRNDRIYDNNPDTTSNKITCVTFRILRLRIDSITGESDMNLKTSFLRVVPPYVPFNVGSVVRSYDLSGRLENWIDLNLPKLELIIEQIDSRMGKCDPLAVNYASLITAMIFIRKLGSNNERFSCYTIHYAKQCSQEWLKWFPDDIEGNLMNGVLHIVAGLQDKHVRTVVDGKTSLHKCYELCDKRKGVSKYREYKYAFGNGAGLAAVVPIRTSIKMSDIPNLRSFTGRLIGNRVDIQEGAIRINANIKQSELMRSVITPDQECLVSCNIAFTKAGMQAVNPNFLNIRQ